MSTKKQRAEAARKVAELVESYPGFVQSEPRFGREWSFETKGGTLFVAVWADDDCDAIFLKFRDPDRAKKEFGFLGQWDGPFNPHSGKWNIHTDTAEQALEILRQRLNRVTGENR